MLIQSCVRLSSGFDSISVAIQVWKPSLALSSGPRRSLNFHRIGSQEEQTLLVQVIAAKRLSLGPPGRRAFYVASKCIGTFTQARLGHRPEHVAIDHRLSDEHQPARDHVNFLHKHEKLENAAGPRPFTVNDPADANKYPIVFFKLSVQSGLILTLSLIFV